MIDIEAEPKGEIYRRLLHYLTRRCDTFSLVRRQQLEFNDEALELEKVLAPHLVREEDASEWPGTQLHGSSARVSFYSLNEASAKILSIADSLYTWQAPSWPEDLAFYAADGECVLGTIAHECDAYFPSMGMSAEELKLAIPGLQVSER